MPTEIDDLQIKINADAQKADDAIDKLVTKLDALTNRLGKLDGSKLTGLANGVNKVGSAVKVMGSVDSRHFSSLAKNITTLGNINTASINRAASSMYQLTKGLNSLGTVSQNAVQIGQVANSLSKLGNKGVTNAITNLPQLTSQLDRFMRTMANAPMVSQNIIDMTNALANLAGQGRSVGAATNTLTNGLNKSNKAMKTSAKNAFSLDSAFGKFYATYFLVIRGIKGLWGSIEKTADYFEALNYFNVAFDKIAGEWSQDYEKYGYENAEAYAESFTDRMEESFSKLSGVQFDTETGLLSDTGLKNLGLNIQEITQYASQLASVTNSLELTGEASLATAQAFTKLAGDMSSLFNIDYADVSANLQSGLIGQSRALYKYGIDITNATLQTKAYELGLSKAVSEMTQGEKAQLRLLSILEQSQIAWGDQANTINSLSNQVRVLKNGWSETSMIFGQLFVPMLENALPIINGLVIALKRLLINVAGFMGVEIDPNKFNTGLNQNEDVLDGITDGFEDATAAAKEYENQILGFDEITKLQDTTATVGISADGGGIDLTQEILDATSEYERIWSEAYSNMDSEAGKWADKISEYFSVNTLFDIGEDVSGLAEGIFNFFSDAIDNVDWEKVGEKIGDFLGGIKWFDIIVAALKLRFNIAKALATAWFASFEEAPLETALLTTLGIMKFTSLGSAVSGNIINALKNAYTSLGGFKSIFTNDLAIVTGAGSLTEIGLTLGAGIIGGLTAAFGSWSFGQWFAENVLGEDWATSMSFGEQLYYIGEAFGLLEKAYIPTELPPSVQALSNSVSSLLGNIRGINNEADIRLTETLGSVEEIDAIKDAYFELADKQGLSADEQLLLVGYAERLITLIPELSGYIDEQTGAYTGEKKAIDEVIKSKKKNMLQDIAEERQKEILGQLVDLELQRAEIEDEYTAAKDRHDARRVGYDSKRNYLLARQTEIAEELIEWESKPMNQARIDAVRDLKTEYSGINTELDTLTQNYLDESQADSAIITSYYALEQQISALNTEYDNYNTAISNGITNTEDFTNAVKGVPTSHATNVTVNTAGAQTNLRNTTSLLSGIKNKNITVSASTTVAAGNLQNVFTRLNDLKNKNISIGASTTSVDTALKNLRTKLLEYEDFTVDISAIVKTSVDEKALKEAESKLGAAGVLGANKLFGIGFQTNIGQFASGGLVDSGQLFIAREAGPELVGSMGSSTAVANNFQIVEGIKQGVYEAVAAAMQGMSSNGGDVVVAIDGKQVFRAVQRQANNYTMQTGKGAFSY